MSAIFNPSPVETPKGLVPARVEPTTAAPPSRWKWWVALGAVLIAGIAAYLVFRGNTQQPATQGTARTATVVVGTLDRVLRVTGTTAASS